MNVQVKGLTSQLGGSDRSASLNVGDRYEAKIVEKKSDREAVVSIRGQKIHAIFEKGVPTSPITSIEVTGKSEEGIQARVVSAPLRQSSGGDPVPSNRTLDLINGQSSEVIKAAERFVQAGVPLTKESVNDLKQYIEKGPKTLENRLDTVRQLVNRQLEPTQSHLQAVHEALHGQSLHKQVSTISPSAQRSASVDLERDPFDSLRMQLNESRNPDTIATLKRLLLQQNVPIEHQRTANELIQRMETLIDQGRGTQALPVLDQLKNLIQKPEPQTNQQQILNGIVNEPNMEENLIRARDVLSTLSMTVDEKRVLLANVSEAEELVFRGRELKGRQLLLETMERAVSIGQSSQQAPPVKTQEYINQAFAQTLPVASRDYVVTTVTQKMALATDDFKQMQRDVSKQLDRIQHLIVSFKAQSQPQVRPMIETTIQSLDRALMRSDWLLFSDMKTERRMLEASSQLTSAKQLLAKGDYQGARKLVNEVSQIIDRLQFKPSDTKVQHFASRQGEWQAERPTHTRTSLQLDEAARGMTRNEGSGRTVFEGLRQLGLTREADIARILAAGKGNIEEASQRNVKGLLMQLAKGEEESGRSQAQQALLNTTGQQLLARSDSQHAHLQSFLLQLPLLLHNQSENLQVFINGRKQNSEQLDWENCRLYFLIETKKLGEVGISLQVSNRTLNLILENDLPDFKRKLEPITKACLKRLEEVGYIAGNISYQPRTREEESPKRVPEKAIADKRKGFDLKV
ncbi:hypothetical protein [Alteribacter aurantiacus]|uniref:hypothetical protein n=1 Tax=Alteribacter aurantiacus TaxID=254410 RepID=UPI0003FF4254|nr:hypothetical protein [Alteribacter aurantiacus]